MFFFRDPVRSVRRLCRARGFDAHQGRYLTWDDADQRKVIFNRLFLRDPRSSAVVFDKLHKYLKWKSYLKGLFDTEGALLRAVLAGSAKLDIFLKRQDSLLGRYEYLRLHPFAVGEISRTSSLSPPDDWRKIDARPLPDAWTNLEHFSGFPESFTRAQATYVSRWSSRRRSLLVHEDIRDLTQVRNLSILEHLALLLSERVGAPLSINSLREALSIAHDTVTAWLEFLDRVYFSFRIKPYHRQLARSLTKEQKLYLWDWKQIDHPAARFENMVASHLLKACHLWSDLGYGEYELLYWQNQDKKRSISSSPIVVGRW